MARNWPLVSWGSEVRCTDFAALQSAILRRSLMKPVTATVSAAANLSSRVPPNAPRLSIVPPPPPIASPQTRPSLEAFALDILSLAAPVAEGFAGNRKAYISRVWRAVQLARPHWGFSEMEFKAMLADAHRSSRLVLANADLKDERDLRDVHDSAVSYRNAVFHFVRVDT